MTKTFDQVMAEVNQIFASVLGKPNIVLRPETTAADVDGWDSLSHIELVVAIDKHFRMRFNFVELQKFKNVGEMAQSITAKVASS
jgi:acyl carrier protein